MTAANSPAADDALGLASGIGQRPVPRRGRRGRAMVTAAAVPPDTPIDQLGLPAMARNALRRAGYTTVGEVAKHIGATHAARIVAAARVPSPHRLDLTPLQGRVVALSAEGLSTAEIAGLLQLSESAVKAHVARACGRVGSANRVQLAVMYARALQHAQLSVLRTTLERYADGYVGAELARQALASVDASNGR